jgi:DNA-directed RNA polymerase specialized sigma24 family protein
MTSGHDHADLTADARTWAALNSLPRPLKEILLLREVERLPMPGVAMRLKISRATAERLWVRAIVLMTERLNEPTMRGRYLAYSCSH